MAVSELCQGVMIESILFKLTNQDPTEAVLSTTLSDLVNISLMEKSAFNPNPFDKDDYSHARRGFLLDTLKQVYVQSDLADLETQSQALDCLQLIRDRDGVAITEADLAQIKQLAARLLHNIPGLETSVKAMSAWQGTFSMMLVMLAGERVRWYSADLNALAEFVVNSEAFTRQLTARKGLLQLNEFLTKFGLSPTPVPLGVDFIKYVCTVANVLQSFIDTYNHEASV